MGQIVIWVICMAWFFYEIDQHFTRVKAFRRLPRFGHHYNRDQWQRWQDTFCLWVSIVFAFVTSLNIFM